MSGPASVGVPPPVGLPSGGPAAPPTPPGSLEVRPFKPPDPPATTLRARAYRGLVGWSAVALISSLRLLPFRWACAFGRLAGLLGWRFSRTGSQALATLQVAFPEKSEPERRRLARESFARVGISAMEWVEIAKVEESLAERISYRGLEHGRAALALGKGIVWITGHIGCWELLALGVHRHFPVAGVATTVRYPRVNRFTIEERAKRGIKTIERGSGASAKELLRQFHSGRSVGFLLDHDSKHFESVRVPYFGSPAWTAIGPAELSLRLGAPAVSAFIVRESIGHWRIEIGPMIVPPSVGVPPPVGLQQGEPPLHPPRPPKDKLLEAARDLTAQYTRRIEEHVRAHPEDWAWMHKRYRP